MRTATKQRLGAALARRAPAALSAALLVVSSVVPPGVYAADGPALVRSVRSGPWSAPATWEGGRIPGAGTRVQVRTGHAVTYDLKSDRVIRSVHVAGTLTFERPAFFPAHSVIDWHRAAA